MPQGDSQNWDRHVWSAVSPYGMRSQPMRELADRNMLASVANQQERIAEMRTGARMQNHEVIGRQQFDGDSIAWKAFLNQLALATGGKRNPYQNRTTMQAQANAARIDAARRSDYLRYIEAGGTSGYNDWLIENDLHARQGGW